jgi:aryl-alcohol dehydrogenase-like predicted oxidoreductase
MKIKENISRREFMISSAGAVVSLAAWSPATKSSYDPKGLPTNLLGKTGIQVPYIGFGTGSRFCSVADEDIGLAILNHALDNGLYYWDTASGYKGSDGKVVSEERLGKVLKSRRKEVFLATKVGSRDIEKAKKELERSLKRLHTNQIDLYQIHNVKNMEDVEELFKSDGLVRFLDDLKSQGIIRFTGFSGHTSAKAMQAMADRYDFDTMLVALNHYQRYGQERREQDAISTAHKKNMGIMAMKVIRPRETVKNISSTELVNYALSLPKVSTSLIGMESIKIMNANIEIIKNFKPLSPDEMNRIRMTLNPFFHDKNLEWMQPGYTDSMYA